MPQPPRKGPSLSGSKPDLGQMTRRFRRSTQPGRLSVTPEMFGLPNATPLVLWKPCAKPLSTPRKPPNVQPVRLRSGIQLPTSPPVRSPWKQSAKHSGMLVTLLVSHVDKSDNADRCKPIAAADHVATTVQGYTTGESAGKQEKLTPAAEAA